jgi:hypothetical protein
MAAAIVTSSRAKASSALRSRPEARSAAKAQVAHRQRMRLRTPLFDDGLAPCARSCGLVAHALQVGRGLGDGDQQAQVARRGLAPRDDGGQVAVDLDFHLVDALFGLASTWVHRLAAELGQRIDGLRICDSTRPPISMHAGETPLSSLSNWLERCLSGTWQCPQPKRPVM